MRQVKRLGSTMALGAMLALGTACGGADDSDTNAAGDSAALATTPGMTDSAAGMAPAAAPAGSDLAGLSEPNVMAMVGLSNAAEIQTSQIAQDKATSAQVKEFARMMVTDHQAMQKQADQLATQLNVTPEAPQQAQQKQQNLDQMLQELNSTAKGAEFDGIYMAGQVEAHKQTLTELQAFQNSVQNAELRNLISQAIPKVQQHLERAQGIQSSLGGAAGATPGAAPGAPAGTPARP